MHIQLHEARDAVRLMAPMDAGHKLLITDARLVVKRVALRAEIYAPLRATWEQRKVRLCCLCRQPHHHLRL